MTNLFLIRHGQTDWTTEGRWQGQLDPPLNENGRKQARQLAQELSCQNLQILYSSDLWRAMQTAQIIRTQLNLMLVPEPRLREIDLGLWQGVLSLDIQAQYPREFQQWYVSPLSIRPPGGEDIPTLAKRVLPVINEIIVRHPGASVGIIAHELPIAVVLCRSAGLPLARIRSMTLQPGTWKQVTLDVPLS